MQYIEVYALAVVDAFILYIGLIYEYKIVCNVHSFIHH